MSKDEVWNSLMNQLQEGEVKDQDKVDPNAPDWTKGVDERTAVTLQNGTNIIVSQAHGTVLSMIEDGDPSHMIHLTCVTVEQDVQNKKLLRKVTRAAVDPSSIVCVIDLQNAWCIGEQDMPSNIPGIKRP